MAFFSAPSSRDPAVWRSWKAWRAHSPRQQASCTVIFFMRTGRMLAFIHLQDLCLPNPFQWAVKAAIKIKILRWQCQQFGVAHHDSLHKLHEEGAIQREPVPNAWRLLGTPLLQRCSVQGHDKPPVLPQQPIVQQVCCPLAISHLLHDADLYTKMHILPVDTAMLSDEPLNSMSLMERHADASSSAECTIWGWSWECTGIQCPVSTMTEVVPQRWVCAR